MGRALPAWSSISPLSSGSGKQPALSTRRAITGQRWYMKFGVIFPQTEIGADPGGVRAYAQAVEAMGYDFLAAYDHVIGVDPTNRPGWRGAYQIEHQFHEPLVLFGYLSGITQRLGFATEILILPQRQAAVVAKQAAEVDVLSGGRLRLGIGLGWNDVEYEVLGENFHNRGRRVEEQVEVLRALWTKEIVTFEGKYHHIKEAGINPLPIQRPIPIWFGSRVEAAMRRAARIGDGWFPMAAAGDLPGMIRQFTGFVREAGRAPGSVGIEARLNFTDSSNPEDWAKAGKEIEAAGGTHLSINTMRAGLTTPDQHNEAVRKFKEA